ncbi:MAG TPA: DUF262 domain-containing protein [Methylobacter sp.]
MSRTPDAELLLKNLRDLGGSAGNMALRESLGWGEEKYFRVRQHLIEKGLVDTGRGKGGSVYLLGDGAKDKEGPVGVGGDEEPEVENGDLSHVGETFEKRDSEDHIIDFVPAVRGDTNAVAMNIQGFMDQFDDKVYYVPNYQRDSSQWDQSKRSLFIESLINNITIPPLIVYPEAPDRNEIVDGQQRVATIRDFLANELTLVREDDAEYRDNVGPIIQGKKFKDLPIKIQKQIKKYVLTIIKLPAQLDLELRLEIFRRINQAGVPLSAQDLRLAVFGQSERVYFIRLAGVYDPKREGSKRMIDAAKNDYGIDYPWSDPKGWTLWWTDNWHVIGQAPSQMFLYYVICRDIANFEMLLGSRNAERQLSIKYDGKTASVLDIYTAQLEYEDRNYTKGAKILANLNMLKGWFDEFELWFNEIKMVRVPQIAPNSATKIALFIASAIKVWGTPDKLRESQWELVQVFLTEGPTAISAEIGVSYPIAKGKWPSQKKQIDATVTLCQKIDRM